MKVFLGGTCAGKDYRKELTPMLKIDWFDPVVDDWTEECQAREIEERATCDFVLYTITSSMEGVYSIAEVVDDSNKRPTKTVLCILYDGFNEKQTKSLKSVEKMVKRNGGRCCSSLEDVVKYLNSFATDPIKGMMHLM